MPFSQPALYIISYAATRKIWTATPSIQPPIPSHLVTFQQYAPVAPGTVYTPSHTALAALDTANLGTGSFVARTSAALVTVSAFVYNGSVLNADGLYFALYDHGGTTKRGPTATVAFTNAATADAFGIIAEFYVTGLTPGNTYNFDLYAAQQTGADWILIVGDNGGTTSALPTNGNLAPVTIKVFG